MQAAKLKTWTTESTAEALFEAILGVVQNGKFTLFAVNNEHRRIMFTTSMSPLSWGREFIGEVDVVEGRTTLNLVCGGVDGRPAALLDPWKNGKAADKFIAEVKSVLDGSTSAPTQAVASFATVGDGTTRPWTGPEYPAH